MKLSECTIGFDPCMNWLEKNEEEEMTWLARKVCYESLIEQVEEAEKSAKSLGKKD